MFWFYIIPKYRDAAWYYLSRLLPYRVFASCFHNVSYGHFGSISFVFNHKGWRNKTTIWTQAPSWKQRIFENPEGIDTAYFLDKWMAKACTMPAQCMCSTLVKNKTHNAVLQVFLRCWFFSQVFALHLVCFTAANESL